MANPFYVPTGNPPDQTRGVSALIRAEFQKIANAFAAVSNVGGINSGIDAGTANNYVINPDVAVDEYSTLMQTLFLALNTNTGASTINISGLGAVNIVRHDRTALLPGDIQGGGIYLAHFDGSEFQLQAISLSGNATGPINEKEADPIAASGTLNLNNMTGNYGHITGSADVTTITLNAGASRTINTDSSVNFVVSPTLIIPGGNNLKTNPGDVLKFTGDTSNKVILTSYTPAIGRSGLIYLGSQSLTVASPAFNFLSIFNASCDNYLIMLEDFGGDNSGTLQMQLAAGGSPISSSVYGYVGNSCSFTGSASNTPFGVGQNGATSAKLTNGSPQVSSPNLGGSIELFNMNGPTTWKMFNSRMSYVGGQFFDTVGGQMTNSTVAASGFKLFLSSGGNFTVGSTVKVYGYQN